MVYNPPASRTIESKSVDMLSLMNYKASYYPWRAVYYLPTLEEKRRRSAVYLVESLYPEQGLEILTSWLGTVSELLERY